MIDKLELLVPDTVGRNTNWTAYPVHTAAIGLPYQWTLDAATKLSLRVHYGHRSPVARGKRHYKVDFIGTRFLSAEDLRIRLASLFRIGQEEAMCLQVARIDFAADVFGVPVAWFKRNCRAKGKKKLQSFELLKEESDGGTVNTLQFGKRPDLYRIYDRVTEALQRRNKEIMEWKLSGYPIPIVTRIERQCSGRAIPHNLRAFGEFLQNASATDPFPNLVCTQVGNGPVPAEDWTPRKWLMCLGLAAAVNELGIASVRARLNRTGGNAKRLFEQYSDLLTAESPGVTMDRIRQTYRKSTIRQLNLPVTGVDGTIRYPMGGLSLTL